MRTFRISSVGALLALVALAHGARAQVIRGSVVLPDSVTPLAGAIVVATDRAGGVTATQGLANSRGEFVLRLPRRGQYGLRVLRIGYRPTVGPIVDVGAADTVRVRLVFRAEAVVLTAFNVRDKETCRVGADSGMMVARVWARSPPARWRCW